jgi:hypothetical protein
MYSISKRTDSKRSVYNLASEHQKVNNSFSDTGDLSTFTKQSTTNLGEFHSQVDKDRDLRLQKNAKLLNYKNRIIIQKENETFNKNLQRDNQEATFVKDEILQGLMESGMRIHDANDMEDEIEDGKSEQPKEIKKSVSSVNIVSKNGYLFKKQPTSVII